MRIQEVQEAAYEESRDYRVGSPHLTHRKLFEQLLGLLRESLQPCSERGLPGTVLEIGAGDGSFTEPLLAYGYEVTATEVSRASIERLNRRYGANRKLNAVYDPEGSLQVLGNKRYSSIVCISVLHHIPDYEAFVASALKNHLSQDGTFLSLQDPLWYPSLGNPTRWFSQLAYLSWRMTQGNYLAGIQTQIRRVRRIYDDTKPGDAVEYHVVRQGVDQRALVETLSKEFRNVRLIPYWSSQSALAQRLGGVLSLKNTFGISATGYDPSEGTAVNVMDI